MRWGGAGCFIFALLALAPAFGNEPAALSEEARRALILGGLDSLYDLQFDDAIETFARLASLEPAHPTGPFYAAVVLTTKAAHGRPPGRQRLESLTQANSQVAGLLDEAVRRARARLAATPPAAGSNNDPTFHLVLAGALALQGQRAAEQRHYLSAWNATKEGYAHLLAAAKQPGGQAEAAYGLGSLHYYLAQLPRFSRTLVGWVLITGDHDRGLQELELAAHQAVYTRMTARIELAYIYTNRERRYDAALPYAEEAARRYSKNPDFAFLLANVYSELGRSAEADTVAETIRERLEAGRYEEALWPRYEHLIGKIALDRGAPAEAREHFMNALHVHDDQYLWVKAWALTRLGMVEDLEGNRAAAVARYREALALKTGGSAEDAAKAGLRKPYTKALRTSRASGR